jgi:hypothetical protein
MTSTNLAKTVAWCVCLLASPRAMAGGGGTPGPLFRECCLLPLPFLPHAHSYLQSMCLTPFTLSLPHTIHRTGMPGAHLRPRPPKKKVT